MGAEWRQTRPPLCSYASLLTSEGEVAHGLRGVAIVPRHTLVGALVALLDGVDLQGAVQRDVISEGERKPLSECFLAFTRKAPRVGWEGRGASLRARLIYEFLRSSSPAAWPRSAARPK